MDTLWEGLLTARSGRFRCWTGNGFTAAGWDEVVSDARRMAGGLRAVGVRPGETIACILTNTPLAVRGTLAVWLAGGAVASLPVPARGMSPAEYARQIEGLCDLTGSPRLHTDAATAALLPDGLRARTTVWESVGGGPARVEDLPGPDDPAFVQFSSGSTSAPKGCVLTPRAVAAQLHMILAMSDAVPGREHVVSWLPLSHDMGMFGCLLFPWFHDMSLALSTPERFAVGPRTWFADLADFGGTMTAGTNTALRLAARAQRRPPEKPLAVRTAIIGAERVERDALLAAVGSFGSAGLTLARMMPAYGMAEATLAVSATGTYDEPSTRCVDAIALADGKVLAAEPGAPGATWLVGNGRPCRGVEVTAGQPDTVTELVVRAPSLATGYFADPARSAARFTEAGFRTGDLGFVSGGEVFVVGRMDDVITVGGRNVNTREIELAVDALDRVRAGSAAVIDADGPVLVAEPYGRGADPAEIAVAAAAIALEKAGIALRACVFVRRGAVPKTPSGKIQRYRTRHLLLAGELPTITTVSLDGAP